MRDVHAIILHWIGEGSSLDYIGQAAVNRIRNYHINVNHWNDIGYHYLIDRNGDLFPGRPEYIIGAHAYGSNVGTIGVNVMFGTKDKEITPKAMNTLVKLLSRLCKKYNITPTNKTILGHRDVFPTECPGILYPKIPWIIGQLNGKSSDTPVVSTIYDIEDITPFTCEYNDEKFNGLLIDSQGFLHITDLQKIFNFEMEWDNINKTLKIKR